MLLKKEKPNWIRKLKTTRNKKRNDYKLSWQNKRNLYQCTQRVNNLRLQCHMDLLFNSVNYCFFVGDYLTNSGLEDLLAFDDIFLDYFNNFLKNPVNKKRFCIVL